MQQLALSARLLAAHSPRIAAWLRVVSGWRVVLSCSPLKPWWSKE